jgi:DNA-binding PadR family transcriptional regulator
MRYNRRQQVLEALLKTNLTPYQIAKSLGMKYISQIYPIINSLKAKGLYDEKQRPTGGADDGYNNERLQSNQSN